MRILLRIFNSALNFALIVTTVPLTFDLGGVQCGLAYTLVLSLVFFVLITLRDIIIARGRSNSRDVLNVALMCVQHIVVLLTLLLVLNAYSDESKRKKHESNWWVQEMLVTWSWLLTNMTPVFTLVEGFASLLVIQACGQFSRWCVKNKSDVFLISTLVASASAISAAVYMLYRICTFDITTMDALLIGVSLTIAVGLCVQGVATNRGSVTESALLVSYVVYNLYFCTTNFKRRSPAPSTATTELPLFPPLFTTSNHLISTLASSIPSTLLHMMTFIRAATATLSPSVTTSLAYRLLVLYAATRIIPAAHDAARPSPPSSHPSSSSLFYLFRAYSPIITIATYVNLLSHVAQDIPSLSSPRLLRFVLPLPTSAPTLTFQAWRYINMFVVLGLYAFETRFEGGDGELLLGHLKAT